MRFTYMDRLNIGNDFFPKDGSIVDLMMFKSIADKLALTPEDLEYLEWKEDNGRFMYNGAKAADIVEFDLHHQELTALEKYLKKLDTEKKFPMWALDIWIQLDELNNKKEKTNNKTKGDKAE